MLSDMGVPGWLLRIVASYLTNRTLSVRFKGSSSENKNMPGGTPAGTILGLNLFLILFNYAGPPANNISLGKHIIEKISKSMLL